MGIKRVSFGEFIRSVEEFHGNIAPGIVVGKYMLEKAYNCLPEEGLYDVICETRKCLPDAVQLLTPCSIGNGWLKILDYDRFAVVVYDKHTREGVRVSVSQRKLEKWPVIREWFLKLKPKDLQDTEALLAGIREAGERIFETSRVLVDEEFGRKIKGVAVAVCPVCNEPYEISAGSICRACAQGVPYQPECRSGRSLEKKAV